LNNLGEKKMTKQVKKQETRTIKDLTDMELKAAAFEIDQQSKILQQEYQIIIAELVKRQKK